ncbi:MAG: substrate-binding domain-containing protein [Deinococcus-Thermus bacterium]|jgi:DNA-binding LacI/PurR family transcriptional regulator|nr:substrate-binding domain-containing protein [Deinococcota bacterium]
MVKRVTSREVANAAGVSPALVSRVMTGRGHVAEATSARIREAAAALGWQPNALAASMVTGDAPLIAVVTARLDFDWRAQVLSRLLAAFEERGVAPMMFYAAEEDRVPALIAETGRWQTRGVVVTAGDVDPELAESILRQGRFVAGLNRPVPAAGGYAVGTDNAAAGAQAAGLLARAGRDRPAVLAGPRDSRAGSERVEGFLGAAGGAAVVHTAGMTAADGAAAAAQWLALSPGNRPDGVFAANDMLAIGFIDGLRTAGVQVPDDVALIGFDNLPASAWAPYDLATFAQPVSLMVEGVLGHIDAARGPGGAGPAQAGMARLPAEPILRGSLGLPVDEGDASGERP